MNSLWGIALLLFSPLAAFATQDGVLVANAREAQYRKLEKLPHEGDRYDRRTTLGEREMREDEGVVALVPVTIAKKNGCWVKLYNGENFSGKTLSIVGPHNLSNLELERYGFNWEGRVGSLEVGPNATVTAYDDQNFNREPQVLIAGSNVRDVRHGKVKGGVESLQLKCNSNVMAE
ncbi:MAG: beta/gamma crystallin domain-containing protein [Bdellovibrionota bacterium]